MHALVRLPVGIYLLKGKNRNTRTRLLRVNNKDTRKTPVVVLMSLLLTLKYFTPCSSVSIVNFEHLCAGWAFIFGKNINI